ncbi:MAG: hypothetical protein NVSMB62_16990 [Acidobacteriaceae bacterium]
MERIVARVVALSVVLGGMCASAQQATGRTRDSTGSPTNVSETHPLSSAAGESVHPSAAVIVDRLTAKNKERFAALERYESDRIYRVEYKGTGGEHHAEMHVHAEYTGLNQKHFTVISETGPRFLCEKVLRKLVDGEQEASSAANRRQTSLSPENYTFDFAGEETVTTPGGSERAWVLHVTPKMNTKFTYRGRVWVSQADYAVMRVAGEPAKSPSWWIDKASFDSRYPRRGEVWLPERNVTVSHVRIGGQATLTIDYGTYPVVVAKPLVNSGLQVAASR